MSCTSVLASPSRRRSEIWPVSGVTGITRRSLSFCRGLLTATAACGFSHAGRAATGAGLGNKPVGRRGGSAGSGGGRDGSAVCDDRARRPPRRSFGGRSSPCNGGAALGRLSPA